MKTVNDIKKEIKDLQYRNDRLDDLDEDDRRKERKKIKARIKYLKPFIAYLESEPTKEFCESELEKAQNKLTAINARFCPPDNMNGAAIGEFRKKFDTEWSVPTIKTHIKNLKFLLQK